MYPAYPLLCLGAALAFEHALRIGDALCAHAGASRRRRRRALRPLAHAALAVSLALSAARTLALVRYYGAPLAIYGRLHHELSEELTRVPPSVQENKKPEQLVCVGKVFFLSPTHAFSFSHVCHASHSSLCIHRHFFILIISLLPKEWYRFASSFFLPSPRAKVSSFSTQTTHFSHMSHTHFPQISSLNSSRAKLAFLRDGFTGQLPAHFELPPPAGSRLVHAHFNDRNREEASRYVPLAKCDWLVDLELEEQKTKRSGNRAWEVIARRSFLDARRSNRWARALYVPLLSARHVTFADYVLLRRIK